MHQADDIAAKIAMIRSAFASKREEEEAARAQQAIAEGKVYVSGQDVEEKFDIQDFNNFNDFHDFHAFQNFHDFTNFNDFGNSSNSL